METIYFDVETRQFSTKKTKSKNASIYKISKEESKLNDDKKKLEKLNKLKASHTVTAMAQGGHKRVAKDELKRVAAIVGGSAAVGAGLSYLSGKRGAKNILKDAGKFAGAGALGGGLGMAVNHVGIAKAKKLDKNIAKVENRIKTRESKLNKMVQNYK